jgi:hypothetical protein
MIEGAHCLLTNAFGAAAATMSLQCFASETLQFQSDSPTSAFKLFLRMRIWQTVRRHYAQGILSRR